MNLMKLPNWLKSLIFVIIWIICIDNGYGFAFLGIFTLYLLVRYWKPLYKQMKANGELYADYLQKYNKNNKKGDKDGNI